MHHYSINKIDFPFVHNWQQVVEALPVTFSLYLFLCIETYCNDFTLAFVWSCSVACEAITVKHQTPWDDSVAVWQNLMLYSATYTSS